MKIPLDPQHFDLPVALAYQIAGACISGLATDKQKLLAAIQTTVDAVKSGNPTLQQFAGQLLNSQLATLPDNWTEQPKPVEQPQMIEQKP